MSAVALAEEPDRGRRRSVEIVLEMLEVASERTRREIQRLLAAELQPPPTAADKRLAQLSFLSSLVNGPISAGMEFGECKREDYDQLRPPTVPSSRHLVEAYGSWLRACRAAYGLQPDGTATGPGRPWPGALRGEPRAERYTRREAIAAVRRCADELGAAGITNAPTSWQYDEWVRRHKLEAERRGQTLRLPTATVIYRQFPRRKAGLSRWQLVLRAAGVGRL